MPEEIPEAQNWRQVLVGGERQMTLEFRERAGTKTIHIFDSDDQVSLIIKREYPPTDQKRYFFVTNVGLEWKVRG